MRLELRVKKTLSIAKETIEGGQIMTESRVVRVVENRLSSGGRKTGWCKCTVTRSKAETCIQRFKYVSLIRFRWNDGTEGASGSSRSDDGETNLISVG